MMNTTATESRPRGLFEASVICDGTPLPLYRRADGRRFAAGVPGRAYVLRVRNLTSGRIEVINTVDGRNTLKDEPGDVQANRGLIFGPRATAEFTGWRITDDETDQFLFGTPERSVAAQATGSTVNVGVIGFAAYREHREPPAFYGGIYASNTAGGGLSAAAASGPPLTRSMTGNLGTGIGERQADHVGRTTFIRTGEPDVLAIGYDTEQALRLLGMYPADPDPFPARQTTGYEKYER